MGEISPKVVHTLSLLMILTSFAAVEAGNLRHATVAYIFQALLICGLLTVYSVENSALLYWAGTALVTKALLPPVFLWRATAQSQQETKPLIGFGPSSVLAILILILMYVFTHKHAGLFVQAAEGSSTPYEIGEGLISLAETNLAVAFTVFTLGIYAILTRRDAIKTVIGLCLLENGVHLSLVSLAPTMRETALAGIATEVVITVWLLLYIIGGIRDRFGTTDTSQLSELHW
ncbi:MAG: NADH-quinone oxidoreductase subunit K [Armatimonadota bacterium]|nr:NADH-quinone oxidoreductase subunit K [Armatimonadota bacterium]